MTVLVDGLINRTAFTNYVQQEQSADRLTIVADPLGERGNVCRAYLVKGDIASGSERAELSMTPEDSPSDSARWYLFSTLLFSDMWASYAGNPITIWQSHDRPDGGDPARRPPLELAVEAGGYWSFRVAGANDGVDPTPIYADVVSADLIRHPFDAWVDWVVKVQYSYTGSGSMTLWKDARKVATCTSQYIGYDDVLGNAAKCGLYCPLGLPTGGSMVAYHSGIVVADGTSSTFDQFMAECSSSDTELEGFVTRGVSL